MTTRQTVVALAILMVGIASLMHPADMIAGGALAGAGGTVAALVRRREERRGEVLDVAMWIDEHSFSCDTAAEIVEYLRGTSLAELRSKVAARAWRDGYVAAGDAEHERRSTAARKGAATRQASTR